MTEQRSDVAGRVHNLERSVREPFSREGRKPIPLDAEIRECMRGLCADCAAASDICIHTLKRRDNVHGYRLIVECDGYVRLSNTSLKARPEAVAVEAPVGRRKD